MAAGRTESKDYDRKDRNDISDYQLVLSVSVYVTCLSRYYQLAKGKYDIFVG
jgi:hypothetical protein